MEKATYEHADIMVCMRDQGLVLKEKSLVAYHKGTGRIMTVGNEAEKIREQDPEGIGVLSPLKNGRVADYSAAVGLFSALLLKVRGKKRFFRPAVAVCVPKGITQVEERALKEAVIQSGAREVMVTELAAKQFIEEVSEQSVKYKIVIVITKEEPENYVKEEIGRILEYAGQEGISRERLQALWEECRDGRPV